MIRTALRASRRSDVSICIHSAILPAPDMLPIIHGSTINTCPEDIKDSSSVVSSGTPSASSLMANVRFAPAPRLPPMWSDVGMQYFLWSTMCDRITYKFEETKKVSDTFSVQHYYDFYWATLELKTELARCRSMFRPLGSCAPVLTAVSSTHAHLSQLRKLFGLNALNLFPEEGPLKQRFRNITQRTPLAYMEALPMVMSQLSDDLKELNNAFRSYSKLFSDEKLATSLIFLSKDLKHEADCAQKYMGTTKSSRSAPLRDLQIRFHLVLLHYTTRLRTIERLLADFLSEGFDVIVMSQQDQEKRYLTMTTIATFFSGVTATMLQMSYQTNARAVDAATNLLLLAALVFSVTSAVSSLVSIAWHKSVVQNPESILPSWAIAWLEKWPRASLMLSGICLSGAICCFVFSTGQTRSSQIAIISLAAFSIMTISCSAIWLIVEEAKISPIYDDKRNHLTEQSFTVYIASALIRAVRFLLLGFRDNRGHAYPSDIEAGDGQALLHGRPVFEGPLKPFEVQIGMDPIPAPTPSSSVPFGTYPQTSMPGPAVPALVNEIWRGGLHPTPADPAFPGAQGFLDGRSSRHRVRRPAH